MHYVEAIKTADGFRGRVYKYHVARNAEKVVQLSHEFATKEEAIKAVEDWCKFRGLEYQIDLP